ncbi:MAG: sigma 54-interacting transcriptional regulator [Planctomycetes bacterium]|nr:sigma 54-interacting transcriptional regulator [Planctomycetota bacterium]MBU4398372.1 sigma 54-interacting transcriptional regulator [Planctomycetota bacterium]MCG2685621.1 sigma 54-interacting transcriptional regulator [Planctomycetales bacterium]
MSQSAYLVIREGSKWSDVFRLVSGQSVIIGRAPTNQIVLKDERCSRNHAEVFMSGGEWTLRDLDSRNGTIVGAEMVRGDWLLKPGDIIRVGRTQLVFVHRLSDAFTSSGDASSVVRRISPEALPAEPAAADDELDVLSTCEPTTITHRRVKTRFLAPGEEEASGVSKIGRAAAKLCRLAFELAKAPDVAAMADLALAGLAEETQTDAGALLLFPPNHQGEPRGEDLEIIASRSSSAHRYHRVSNFLASTVMREGEAVLARNVVDDSTLGSRDSQGEILATSVICAPVRCGGEVFGLIHLYSTDRSIVPDPNDLEFTLAVADTVAVAVENILRRQELADNLTRVRTENVELRERLGIRSDIIGRSRAIRQVTEEIARAASSNSTVLIRGESGVGKELVACGIHYNSLRKDNVFVCLNCAALSADLLASELFGHERGAFTGATERKIGKFEAAHKGTLMLDEIGEMSPGLQAKFLRVLEGHSFERVGGSKPVKVDVRVIAATNRDLERDVADGRFRRDLYFRLRVLEVVVPALRKRQEDISLLADYFLQKFNAETGRRIKGFTPDAMDQLHKYLWPGNVRELKNVVERAVVLCRGREIGVEDLLLTKLATAGDTEMSALGTDGFRPVSLNDVERRHIFNTLNHTGWNKSKAAGILGIERSTLDRKIRRYQLKEA